MSVTEPDVDLGAERRASLTDAVLLLVAVGCLGMFAASSSYNRDVMLLVCLYTLVGLGMYVPLVLHGELSLAYGAYVSIGAYAVGYLATSTGVPPVVGIPLGAAVSAAVALMLGLGTARLNGFYLAGVTLLFDRAFRAFLLDSDWLGGAAGFPSFSPGSIFGVRLTRTVIAGIAVGVTVLAIVYVSRLRRGPFGLLARYQRETGVTVESIEVSAVGVKVLALAAGAGIAAIGGALLSLSNGAVFPETYQFNIVVVAIFAPLLGGQRSPWGALIGGTAVAWLYFGIDVGQEAGALAFAVAVLVVIRVAPGGILGILAWLRGTVRRG